jgi:hypothetical protein
MAVLIAYELYGGDGTISVAGPSRLPCSQLQVSENS